MVAVKRLVIRESDFFVGFILAVDLLDFILLRGNKLRVGLVFINTIGM